MASEFDSAAASAEPVRAQLQELQGLANGFGLAMTTAFRRSAVDGKRLEDVLRSLALSLSSRALNQSLAPLGQGIGGMFAGLIGNLFGGARLATSTASGGATPFASGGVLAIPSYLPMGAGPGTVSPAVRESDGRPGVRTQGGGGVHVTFNVTTPDAKSFRHAEADIGAMLARAVARGQRGM